MLCSQSLDIVLPKENQIISQSNFFNWNACDSCDNYQLIVASEQFFFNIVKDTIIRRSELSYKLPNGRYYWKVIGFDNNQKIDSSNVHSFIVFDLDRVNNLSLWLQSNVGVDTLSGALVNRWRDQSGMSNDLVQSNSTFQGVFVDRILNGFPGIRLNGVFARYDLPNMISSNNYSVSIVYNHFNTRARRRVLSNQSNWFMGIQGGEHTISESVTLAGKAVTSNQFVVHHCSSRNDTLRNYVNDSLYDEVVSLIVPGNNLRLGQDSPEGDFLEFIIINDSVNDSIRSGIDRYLMDKYAPPVNLGDNKIVCSFPDSLKLGIDYALDYQWSTGDTTDAIQVDSAGKYYVTITDMFERQSVDSMWYILDTVDYKANVSFSDTTICKGDSIELLELSERYQYTWNTADTTPAIYVDSAATYKVSVRNCLGQTSVDSVIVNVNKPEFSLGVDTIACFNQPLALQSDSSFNNVNYIWSTGSVNNSIVADTSGTYRLTVTDQYNCAYSDTIQVSIDSSLYGVGLGPDTSLCQGNEVGLINPVNGINTYLWNGGDTTATITIDTAGTYILNFEDNRCASSDTVIVSLKGEAPTADFIASNFCFQDSVSFTDLSFPPQGDTIVEWKWYYGDGDSLSTQNPNHLYPSADTFRTTLQIQTDKGCIDTTNKIVVIDPKPSAHYRYAGSLCAKSAVSFEDSSAVSRGSIAGYLWNFGDPNSQINSSNQENPSHQYDTLGQYPVSLFIESDKGCRDTIVDTVDIAPTPNVAFTYNGLCLSDSTQFINQTVLAGVDSVSAYSWNFVNFQQSQQKSPTIKYNSSGSKVVTLVANTTRGCGSFLRDTVEIYANPIAAFQIGDFCEEAPIYIYDQSNSGDSIVSYQYVFNQTDTAYVANPQFSGLTAGNYDLRMKVETEYGCVDSTQNTVQINPKPTANFSIINNNSGAPYDLAVNNTSQNASSYNWFFGTGDSAVTETPNYTYSDTGTYFLQLVAINAENCRDTIQRNLVVLPFFLDAFLEDIFLTETFDGRLQVAVRVVNTGNNTIENIGLTADLNNEFQFAEQMNKTIFKGIRDFYEFNSTFKPSGGQKVDFVCVHINSVNGLQDDNSTNDSLCVKGFNNEFSFKVFPNPVKDQFKLEMVLPETGDISIEIFDQMGREVLREEMLSQEEGYYLSTFNLGGLRAGLYHLKVSYNGISHEESIIKQ